MEIQQTQFFCTKHFSKKNTQHLPLITAQSGAPVAVQCSSSRTSCLFHVPACQYMSELAQSGCVCEWTHVPTAFIMITFSCLHCLKYNKLPHQYWKYMVVWQKKNKLAKIAFEKFDIQDFWWRSNYKNHIGIRRCKIHKKQKWVFIQRYK